MYLQESMTASEFENYINSALLSEFAYDLGNGQDDDQTIQVSEPSDPSRRFLEIIEGLDEEIQEAENLEFSFSLLRVEGKEILINLEFQDYRKVNIGRDPDVLSLRFMNNTLIVSEKTLKPLESQILMDTYETQIPPIEPTDSEI